MINLAKRCPKCNVEKPASEFYQNRLTEDGLHTVCKSCCVNVKPSAFFSPKQAERHYSKYFSAHR